MAAIKILLSLMLLLTIGNCDVEKNNEHGPQPISDDHHLHESQIPPPSQQPNSEDIRKMLSNIFDLMDKDKDSIVELEELKLWLDKIHSELINDNIEQQWSYYNPPIQEVHSWESYDPEKREALIWEHYINTTYTPDVVQAHLEDANPDEFKSDDPNFKSYFIMLKRAEKRWKAADKNNDTVLVKEEFKFFLHPEEAEHTKHLLVEEAMDDMDQDKNNEITLEEYMKHMNDVSPDEEKNDPNFLQNHQSQFQTYLDKNKDGNLCMIELTEWLIPNYDRHEAEASRMIQDTDNNNDRKLQKDELLQNDQYYLSLIPGEMWRQFSQMGMDGQTTTPSSHDEF